MSNIIETSRFDVTGLIMEEITDESLTYRYGTSLHINMGRDYQKYLETKFTQLNQEFIRINLDSDEGIDHEELSLFLNNYGKEIGKEFSHSYVGRIFEILDKNGNNKISM